MRRVETYEDLDEIVSDEETVDVEYKAWRRDGMSGLLSKRKPSLESYAKEISAFANTAGGLLIIGIDDTSREIHGVPDDSDALGYLNQALGDLTVPAVPGIAVHRVRIPTDPSRSVIVVTVPASNVGPHRSNKDQRYYLRAGERSATIPHIVLTAMMGRTPGPALRLSQPSVEFINPRMWLCALHVENAGLGSAHDVAVEIRSDHSGNSRVGASGEELRVILGQSTFHAFRWVIVANRTLPPGGALGGLWIDGELVAEAPALRYHITLTADRMVPVEYWFEGPTSMGCDASVGLAPWESER